MSTPRLDPGWGPAVIFWRGATDGLTRLRRVYLAFWVALVVLLVVVSLVEAPDPSMSSGLAVTVIAALAAVGISVIGMLRSRPITGSPAAGYVTSVFLRLAFAEMTAIAGFILFFFTGSVGTYVLGAVLAVPGYLMAAPTAADIERRQRELSDRGSPVSLLEALLDWPSTGG